MKKIVILLMLACLAFPAMARAESGDNDVVAALANGVSDTELRAAIMEKRRHRGETKQEKTVQVIESAVDGAQAEPAKPETGKSVVVAKETAPEGNGCKTGEPVVVTASAADLSSAETYPATPSIGESAAGVAEESKTAPPSGTKWDHFHEISAYAGYYQSNVGTQGFWGMAEYIRWNTQRRKAENFGFGVTAKADYGWGENAGVHWGSASIGPNVDYWREVGLNNYFLLKLRPLWRFNESPKPDGFSPGGYLEFDHVLNGRNMLIGTFDATYFKDDSYFNLNFSLEHRFGRNVKVRAGLGLTWQGPLEDMAMGIGPTLSIKFYNRLTIGASLNFFQALTTWGVWAGYEINTDMIAVDASFREKSVSKKESGETAPMPTGGEDPQLTKAGGNAYSTLPGATEGGGMQISEKPLFEEVQK